MVGSDDNALGETPVAAPAGWVMIVPEPVDEPQLVHGAAAECCTRDAMYHDGGGCSRPLPGVPAQGCDQPGPSRAYRDPDH